VKKNVYTRLSLSLLHWRRQQEERLGGVGPWLGPTTQATILGQCITFIAHTVLEESNYLFIFSTLSWTFRRSSAITKAVGNTNTSGATAHIDTYYVVTPSYQHILTCCQPQVASEDSAGWSIIQYDRVSFWPYKMRGYPPVLSICISQVVCSGLNVSMLWSNAEHAQV